MDSAVHSTLKIPSVEIASRASPAEPIISCIPLNMYVFSVAMRLFTQMFDIAHEIAPIIISNSPNKINRF